MKAMKNVSFVKSASRVLAVAAVSLCVGNALAAESTASYEVGSKGNASSNVGTATVGEGYRLDTTGRLLLWQGTLTINEGAYMKFGGNSSTSCNFIGIENGYSGAVVNINGGTLWCSTDNGAGYLAVGSGIGKNNTSTLTLNSGVLKVDAVLRSSAQWDDKVGVTASGTITINGGEATAGTVYMGTKTVSTGTSTLNLNGGTLTTGNINFRTGNGQVFTWHNGTLVATKANIFNVEAFNASNTKTRTMQITGIPASFDTAGFAQSIPAFTGTGKLRLTGGGAVTFSQSTLTYGLIFDGITLNLGTLDAGTTPITTPNLEIIGPATLNVTLPESPSGRYPLIACTSSLDGSLGQITVSGGGAGVLLRDGNTLYLSFDAADADSALVYSAAAGGADTPAESSYARLAFTDTAGAFTVGGDGLSFSQDIADASVAAQDITVPVTLSTDNSSIYVAEGGRLALSGGLTATTPKKEGKGTLVLSHATKPASIIPKEGILDFGGDTYTGSFTINSRRYNGEEIVLTNGTWRPSAGVSLAYQGSTIRFADGFVADFSAQANSRIALNYAGVASDYAVTTKLVIDGGSLTTADNGSNSGNFVGVQNPGLSILEVKRGVFHAAGGSGRGYLRIAAQCSSTYLTGIVRVSGGLLQIDRDLSMGTVYNGLNGNNGKGVFELSGGVADVGNFYLGANTSTPGRSEVHLTGGVLEVGVLKCLAYNRQMLVADGATIRAKNNDTAVAPFMAKVASADGYAKTYTIGAGGLTIDTAGHNVHCDIPWTGEGGLTVTGGGSLALARTLTVGGDSVIASGTTLVLTNSVAFGGKVTLGENAKIRIDTTSYQEDSLTIATTDGFMLPSGVTDVLDLVELVGDGFVASVSADGKSIELGLAANVAAFAWWTGGGDPTDFDDPANWACTNSTGGVVANALPVKSTVVVLSGTTSFTVPAGTTPVWVTTQIGGGNGGAVTLGADCDWSAAPNLTIADGSYLDLHGHSLKISYLTAAEGESGAYVTNSVAGTKPALWAENVFSEKNYIDTEKVTVYTDFLEVKSVNDKTFTIANQGLGWSFDAGLFVTNGTTTVTGDSYPGRYGHTATISVSGNASLRFQGYTHFRGGVYDDSGVYIFVTNNATFSTSGYITIGHHNSGPALFRQDGGTVSLPSHLNLGVGNTSTARYEITAGTLTVGDSFAIGRMDNYEGNVPGIGMFVQSGGTVNANRYLSIGWSAGSEGSYIMSGGTFTITANRVNLGSEGTIKMGLWDISGGTATAAKGMNVAHGSGSTAKLRLSGSGKLVTADITGGAGASTVEFDGGTLEANADKAAFISGITNAVVFGANAVTLDTAGHNLGITNCVLRATPGSRAITLTGGGTLDFTNATLDFTEPLTRGFVLAQVADSDAATFTSVPALAEGVKGYKIKLSADGKTIKVVSEGLVIFVK